MNACLPDLPEVVRRLVDMANEAGGRDNTSVVLVRVEERALSGDVAEAPA
jgi:serine/threonine protein phosphatase PrpC